MAEVPSYVGTEFDIFVRKPKQSSTVETNETIYRPIASVDQTDIEFKIPGDRRKAADRRLHGSTRNRLHGRSQQSSSFAIQSVHDLPKRHSDHAGHGAVPLSSVYRDPLDLRQRCRKLAPHDALLAARRREHDRRRLLKTRTDE